MKNKSKELLELAKKQFLYNKQTGIVEIEVEDLQAFAEGIVKLFAIPDVNNNEVAVCPNWMHKERRKLNDDNFCPICGTDIRQIDC